ncbi:lasso peptide biosynthesis B2 protein [Streptomyces sp. NPDC048637]|uniref:lasso peptide biosynthesis B2 protein n=1 Tax=Streptomyces sp. NPDC048637 TaxID=3155636 RepID=UPI003446FD7C
MSQVLEKGGRPELRRRLLARAAVMTAFLLATLPPRRIRAVLRLVRWRAKPTTYDQALAARSDVVAVNARCAGSYCLQRSLATTLLCRARGTWPAWIVGVRTPPFAAHAWVEVDGHPVGEPVESSTYRAILAVRPMTRRGR